MTTTSRPLASAIERARPFWHLLGQRFNVENGFRFMNFWELFVFAAYP